MTTLDDYIARSLARDPEAFAALFTDDATMSFPFHDQRFAGRAAILERVRAAWRGSPFRAEAYADLVTLATADAIVAEYTVRGTIEGTAVAVPCVLRLDLAPDGRIAAMREYIDPGRAAAARPPHAILRRYHAAMQAKSADALADLYAEDGIHEFGFAVPNRPAQIVGREAIRASYTEGWRDHPLDIQTIEEHLTFQALDPEVIVSQWRARATHRGAPVELTGLNILRVRANAIVHAWDFMDALGISRALGRPPFA